MREVEWRGGGEGVRAGEGLPVSPRVSERRGYGTFLFFLFFFFPPSPPPSRSGTVHNSRARPIPMINVINMALAASEGRASSPHPHHTPSCGCAKEQILEEFCSISKLRYNRECGKGRPCVIQRNVTDTFRFAKMADCVLRRTGNQ